MSTPILTGPELDELLPEPLELLELPELHAASSAATAIAAETDTPKRLRIAIGPPVSTPSGLRSAPSRPPVNRTPVVCLENRSDVSGMSTPICTQGADRHRNDMWWLSSHWEPLSTQRRASARAESSDLSSPCHSPLRQSPRQPQP